MNIYTDSGHYRREHRGYLADILRPYLNNRTIEQNNAIYGQQINRHRIVQSIEEADLCVLPLNWVFYIKHNCLDMAIQFVRYAQNQCKKVAVWTTGDYGIDLPVDGVWEFRQSGRRSFRKPRQFALPVIIRDPLLAVGLSTVELRSKGPQPVVGFCGQADDRFLQKVRKCGRIVYHNTASYLGLSPYETLPWYLPTSLRRDALDVLDRDLAVETHFIRKKHYFAGADSPDEMSGAQQVFYDNIRRTDYTLCVRGTGNFSTRLYETLAMGRIPVFLDTDCILPYDSSIDWKQYCVWVEYSELNHLSEIVSDFHRRLSDDDFKHLQRDCRRLWEEHLTFNGFLTHFPEHFN